MALTIPQDRSCECGYTRGNGCRGVSDPEIPSLQNTFNCLGLPWNETSPEQGYPDASVDHTLLQDEEDYEEEEHETSHDK